MALSVLDFINATIARQGSLLTREEFKRIRNHGTLEEFEDALIAMEAAGGYDNLA